MKHWGLFYLQLIKRMKKLGRKEFFSYLCTVYSEITDYYILTLLIFMKKLLLFALGAMVSMASYAQEEDVTHYIQNAGFDEDLTWLANGSTKEIVDKSKVLSDRSLAGLSADGSLYAIVNKTTSKSRADGRTFEATNGFVGQMKGWEWVNLDDATKPILV